MAINNGVYFKIKKTIVFLHATSLLTQNVASSPVVLLHFGELYYD